MNHASIKDFVAPSTQFLNSMAIVIGPTPPGTGVMYDAFSDASLKLTSPTSLYPLFAILDSMEQRCLLLRYS